MFLHVRGSMERVFAVAIMLISIAAFGQVTARQGEPPPPPNGSQRFKSPMVLELPLLIADPNTWGVGDVRGGDDLSKFICDGVAIETLDQNASNPRSGQVKVTFKVVLYVEPGVDKRVDVAVEILRGADRLAATAVRNIKAGEKKRASAAATTTISEDDLRRDPRPTLRITVSVRDDA